MTRKLLLVLLVMAMVLGGTLSLAASDHLFNAATSNGAGERGFANPVAANPSGTSGANAQPATVPGEGNPKAGGEQGTPSVDLGLVSTRSGGNGSPVGPSD